MNAQLPSEQNVYTAQEIQARRKEEIDAMQSRLTELTSRLEGLEIDMKKFTATIQQVTCAFLATFFYCFGWILC